MIKDLISLDPSLQSLEAELNTLVLELVKNKPESNLDPEFEAALKLEVLKRVEGLKTKELKKTTSFSWSVFMKKTSFSLVALTVAILIIIPVTKQLANKLSNTDKGLVITQLKDNAFGEILSFNTDNKEVSENVDMLATKNNDVSTTMAQPTGGLSLAMRDVSVSSPHSMLYPPAYDYPSFNYPSFTYVYEGEDLQNVLENLDEILVYRLSPEASNSVSILKSIINSNNKLIDFKKFQQQGLKLNSFSFSEEKDFAYNINFDNGNIYLYQNWKYWPEPKEDFKYENLLSDDEVINIAEKFLKDYGIKRSAYGKASISYNFHDIYAKTNDKSMIYVPSETVVVFPILINAKEVKDESGEPYGLSITVSSIYKKVISLNNLRASSYESSIYKAFTDIDRLKEIAENGGLNNYQGYSDGNNNIEVRLGNPEIILSKQYYYNDKDGSNSEIFVPALSFPVIGLSEETEFFTQKSIIIPLLKDIIDSNSKNIMPMPIMIYEAEVMD